MDVFSIILTCVYIVVGLALIWFVVELALTMRKVRSTVEDLEPTLENVEKMVTELQPTITKVDPLMDRVTLTVDSVNLELMRVDGILENVNKITGGVSKTVDAVDSVTSAPLDIVTNMTKKMRSKFRPRYASEESVDLGSEGAPAQPQNPITDFVDATTSAAAESFREESDKRHRVRAEQQARAAQAQAAQASMDSTRDNIATSVHADSVSDLRSAE